MSETVAARINEETKQWLETKADQEDISVSSLAADILETNAGDIDDTEPDSAEARINQIEEMVNERFRNLAQRINKTEQDINKLVNHSEDLEYAIFRNTELSDDITISDHELRYPELPGNDSGNVYETEREVTLKRF